MSDQPDLSQIKPPSKAPPDQPDQNTTAETQELKKKSLTPLEREAEAHRAHNESLRERIGYHQEEKVELQKEVMDLRNELAEERRRIENLAVRCARLEVIGFAVGCITVLGNFIVIVGSVFLGIAGAMPSLTDSQKTWCTTAGTSAAICGGLSVLCGYLIGFWTKPHNR